MGSARLHSTPTKPSTSAPRSTCRESLRCSASFGSVPCLRADRPGRGELKQLHRCSIVNDERHTNSRRRLVWRDQNLSSSQGFVQIVDGKGNVRNDSDDLGHVAMRLEPDPLDPIGTGLETGDVNPEVRDMMLLSTRLRVWNPDVVVPPSELRCHGRRLMVQSRSARHGSLHLTHRLRSFGLSSLPSTMSGCSAYALLSQQASQCNAPVVPGSIAGITCSPEVRHVHCAAAALEPAVC